MFALVDIKSADLINQFYYTAIEHSSKIGNDIFFYFIIWHNAETNIPDNWLIKTFPELNEDGAAIKLEGK